MNYRLSLNGNSNIPGESGSTLHEAEACCSYDAIRTVMLREKPKGLQFILVSKYGNTPKPFCSEYTPDKPDIKLTICELIIK